MILSLLWLIVGVALIIKGGDLFVTASVRLAEILKIPRVIVGTTLVSLATTSPELVVSVMASLQGEPGLAIGNALGSCICNLGLIVGVLAFLTPFSTVEKGVLRAMLGMTAMGLLAFGLTLDRVISGPEGALLLAGAAVVVSLDLVFRTKSPADVVESARPLSKGQARTSTGAGRAWGLFLVGAVMVLVGSRLLVDSATEIAAALGVPSIIIGLTVVAIGTSLPELVTAISSALKGVSDLSLGNLLGANILNIGLIMGVSGMIHPLEMTRFTQLYNFPAMILFMGLVLGVYLVAHRFGRLAGGVLLGLYALYLAGLVLFYRLA